ncbi:class I SAM-dependent methyltransferase [Chengkuizengella axinellae]|uniref:Class I SAM-dependent methyltransferase n=1 Tax=Chengkuizengella axinellae TaxID=3064388 RepID=A0ABT9IY65_9BACL|nr:class I SAM-dependent methyltransferase [Chengkuizengella sp. 2205SS18-9]MDP5274265.1 class I SAM-dependent methyltransferase [Chengkuizengella sp. 2205SS18-9]
MKAYWTKRFKNEGMIWGDQPSKTAEIAKQLFEQYEARKILVPGGGYGRNTKLFSASDFEVDAIEISEEAIHIAKEWDKKTHFYHGSVFEMPFSFELYDAIYCYDVIHLFLAEERKLLIDKCFNQLKENGYLFFTCFSELEDDFGKGNQVEENTFESKPGKIVHYFTEEDLKHHFKEGHIIETGIVEDTLYYSSGDIRKYYLRYIFVKK